MYPFRFGVAVACLVVATTVRARRRAAARRLELQERADLKKAESRAKGCSWWGRGYPTNDREQQIYELVPTKSVCELLRMLRAGEVTSEGAFVHLVYTMVA